MGDADRVRRRVPRRSGSAGEQTRAKGFREFAPRLHRCGPAAPSRRSSTRPRPRVRRSAARTAGCGRSTTRTTSARSSATRTATTSRRSATNRRHNCMRRVLTMLAVAGLIAGCSGSSSPPAPATSPPVGTTSAHALRSCRPCRSPVPWGWPRPGPACGPSQSMRARSSASTPKTGRKLRKVKVGDTPLRVTFDGKLLWVSVFGAGKVVAVDPQTGKITKRVRVPGPARGHRQRLRRDLGRPAAGPQAHPRLPHRCRRAELPARLRAAPGRRERERPLRRRRQQRDDHPHRPPVR